MKLAPIRGLLFAIAALAVIAVWELLTLELPREPVSEIWKSRLFLHVGLALGITVSVFAGATAGSGSCPLANA